MVATNAPRRRYDINDDETIKRLVEKLLAL